MNFFVLEDILMDSLFENNYTRTLAITKELYRYWSFKRPFLVVFDILFGLFFVYHIIEYVVYHYSYNLIMSIYAPLFFLLQFYLYHRAAKTVIKRDMEIMNGRFMNIKIIATDQLIQNISSTGSISKVPYFKIEKVIQTKNLILLRSEAKLIYMLPKNSFTKGTPEEFIAFLRQKGLKVS